MHMLLLLLWLVGSVERELECAWTGSEGEKERLTQDTLNIVAFELCGKGR